MKYKKKYLRLIGKLTGGMVAGPEVNIARLAGVLRDTTPEGGVWDYDPNKTLINGVDEILKLENDGDIKYLIFKNGIWQTLLMPLKYDGTNKEAVEADAIHDYNTHLEQIKEKFDENSPVFKKLEEEYIRKNISEADMLNIQLAQKLQENKRIGLKTDNLAVLMKDIEGFFGVGTRWATDHGALKADFAKAMEDTPCPVVSQGKPVTNTTGIPSYENQMCHFTPLLGLFDQNKQVDYTELPPEQQRLVDSGTSIKISKYPLEDGGFLISVIQTRIIPGNKVKNFRYLIKIDNNHSITSCGEFKGGGNITEILENVEYNEEKKKFELKLNNGDTIFVDFSVIMALKNEGDGTTLAGCITENTGLVTHDRILAVCTINSQTFSLGGERILRGGISMMMIAKAGEKTQKQQNQKATHREPLKNEISEDELDEYSKKEIYSIELQEAIEKIEFYIQETGEFIRNNSPPKHFPFTDEELGELETKIGELETLQNKLKTLQNELAEVNKELTPPERDQEHEEAIPEARANRGMTYNITQFRGESSKEEDLKRRLLYNKGLIHKLNKFDLESMKIELLASNTNTGALTGALGDDRRNNPVFGDNLVNVFRTRGQIVNSVVAAQIIYSLIITFKYGNSKVGLFIKNYIKKEEILEQFERSIVGSIEKYTQGESVKPHIKEMLETIVTNLITLIEQTLKKEKNALKEKIEALEEELEALKKEEAAAYRRSPRFPMSKKNDRKNSPYQRR